MPFLIQADANIIDFNPSDNNTQHIFTEEHSHCASILEFIRSEGSTAVLSVLGKSYTILELQTTCQNII